MTRSGLDTLNIPFSIGDISMTLTALYISNISGKDSSLRPRPFIVHSHNHTEIQYVLSGQGTLVTDSGKTPFPSGSLILVPPGIKHRLELDSTLSRLTLCLQIFSPAGRESSETRELFAALHPSSPIILAPVRDSNLVNCLSRLSDLAPKHRPDIYFTEQLRAFCMLFILSLRAALPAPQEQSPAYLPLPAGSQMVVIDNFFHQHHYSSPPASRLADLLHISPRQLNRILKNFYGMNYREKLNATRLHCAVEQLTSTDIPVANISSILGYGSTTAFGSFIKAQTGRTPSQIRAAGRLWPGTEKAEV